MLAKCQCRGSCGNVICKARANAVSRYKDKIEICQRRPLPGLSRCRRCKCEDEECDNARLVTHDRRWCKRHRENASPSSGMYCNRFGSWKFSAGWPLILRCVAKFACSWALCMPPDVVATDRFAAQALHVIPGTGVQPHQLVWLCLVCVLKWPPMIANLGVMMLNELPPTCQGHNAAFVASGDQPHWHHRLIGQQICDVLIALLQAADGSAMQELTADSHKELTFTTTRAAIGASSS